MFLRLLSNNPSLPPRIPLSPSKSCYTIGRESDQDIILKSSIEELMISRRHARLDYNPERGTWTIVDNRSLNGLFVNDRKVATAELRPNDRITFGGGHGVSLGSTRRQPLSAFIYQLVTGAPATLVTPRPTAQLGRTFSLPLTAHTPAPAAPGAGSPVKRGRLTGVKRKSSEISGGPGEDGSEDQDPAESSTNASGHEIERRLREDLQKRLEEETEKRQQAERTLKEAEERAREEADKAKAEQERIRQELEKLQEEMNERQRQQEESVAALTESKKRIEASEKRLEELSTLLSAREADMKQGEEEANRRLEEVRLAKEKLESEQARHIQQLKEQFECALCLEFLVEPLLLSCSHTMCEECIVNLFATNEECPMCRALVCAAPVPALPVKSAMEQLLPPSDLAAYRERVKEWEAKKADDRKEAAKLRTAVEARPAGAAFLDITRPWAPPEVKSFFQGFDRYWGEARLLWCSLVGLTKEAIERAGPDWLGQAGRNLGMTMEEGITAETLRGRIFRFVFFGCRAHIR